MRNRVERLRLYLLAGAGLLVIVIAAFIGSARYLRRHYLANLPAKLGVNIVRETNGYTYCQTIQGRTAYCIHASKAVEHTDGKIALHDVAITLYGKKSDRSDRIYGDEFEYDQNAQVVRATGVVHIDLQAANQPAKAKVMHVTTSGLVYLEKLGVAATSAPIEFETGGITGHAIGADYASDSGVLVLHSAVDMAGVSGGRPFALTAASAEFDDHSQQALLTHATYKSEGRTATANQSVLYRRPDGTLSRVDAQGDVTLELKGAKVVCQRADVALTAKSQPQTAVLTGGVVYTAQQPLKQMRGEADEAIISFDSEAQPQPQHAVFTGHVHVTEQIKESAQGAGASAAWSTRELTAAKLVTDLAVVKPGVSQLRDAEATGNARMIAVNRGTAHPGTLELSADDLRAHLVPSSDPKQPPHLDTIVGRGNTFVRQLSVDGVEQTSTGDSLNAKFRPAARAAKSAGPADAQLSDSLLSAVQQGHVTVVRNAPAKGAQAAAVERATAERAIYDGEADRVTLTGGVRVLDAGSELWAAQVALDHGSGDTHAEGSVKVNYVQPPSAGKTGGNGSAAEQPTHVLADRADLDHETQVTTFYGRPVRLWQGGNQVLAPVVEFSQAQRRLIAHGEGQTGWSASAQSAQVHTVLTQSPGDVAAGGQPGAGKQAASGCAPTAASGTGTGSARAPSVVRIASGGMVYSEILREADFTGGFRADTADGTIRGAEGTVYLQPRGTANTAARSGDAAAPSLQGALDRVVVVGRVELDKPGLKATGARLVYTAADRTALLTGDRDNPPTAVDAQGTTTGPELRFRSSCGSGGNGTVEVLGSPGHPAQTEAPVPGEDSKEKGKH